MTADFATAALNIRRRYLNLLEAALTGDLYRDPAMVSMLSTTQTTGREK
jgi:hypothetical protein